jgi:hypothetical protein
MAQAPPDAGPPKVELVGSWTMVNDEERLIRIDPGPELGNFTGFPLNAAARQKALAWNSTIQAIPEHQSRPHAEPEPAYRRNHRPRQPPADRVHAHGPLREREPHDLARRPAASLRRGGAPVDRFLDG